MESKEPKNRAFVKMKPPARFFLVYEKTELLLRVSLAPTRSEAGAGIDCARHIGNTYVRDSMNFSSRRAIT
jgi:hypothetical protein